MGSVGLRSELDGERALYELLRVGLEDTGLRARVEEVPDLLGDVVLVEVLLDGVGLDLDHAGLDEVGELQLLVALGPQGLGELEGVFDLFEETHGVGVRLLEVDELLQRDLAGVLLGGLLLAALANHLVEVADVVGTLPPGELGRADVLLHLPLLRRHDPDVLPPHVARVLQRVHLQVVLLQHLALVSHALTSS